MSGTHLHDAPATASDQTNSDDLLRRIAPFLKPGQKLSLIDGLPCAPFSVDTSGLRANAYYWSHPDWLQTWFHSICRYPEFKERWHALCGTWDNKIVVDIGCGPGNLFDILGGSPKILIGVDVASGSLHWAKSLGYLPLLADAHALPLKSQFADIVAMNATIHHCDFMDQVVAEAARLVKPGGMLIADHDPHRPAFNFRGLGKAIWNSRTWVYRLIRRPGHRGDEQKWALETEIHHRAGDGITASLLQDVLAPLGFEVQLYPHNVKVGAEILRGQRGRAPLRMRLVQLLSGINPNSEQAALLLLCVARRTLPTKS
jgi:SAM-dependent methyltransferase